MQANDSSYKSKTFSPIQQNEGKDQKSLIKSGSKVSFSRKETSDDPEEH